jgi:hypothetical protein
MKILMKEFTYTMRFTLCAVRYASYLEVNLV